MKATTSQQPSGPRAGEVLLEARGVTSGYGQMPVVRDLDLDKILEVRNTWQFFRDRRPDAYEDLVRP